MVKMGPFQRFCLLCFAAFGVICEVAKGQMCSDTNVEAAACCACMNQPTILLCRVTCPAGYHVDETPIMLCGTATTVRFEETSPSPEISTPLNKTTTDLNTTSATSALTTEFATMKMDEDVFVSSEVIKCVRCHAACQNCTGTGPENCSQCAEGYEHNGGTCVETMNETSERQLNPAARIAIASVASAITVFVIIVTTHQVCRRHKKSVNVVEGQLGRGNHLAASPRNFEEFESDYLSLGSPIFTIPCHVTRNETDPPRFHRYSTDFVSPKIPSHPPPPCSYTCSGARFGYLSPCAEAELFPNLATPCEAERQRTSAAAGDYQSWEECMQSGNRVHKGRSSILKPRGLNTNTKETKYEDSGNPPALPPRPNIQSGLLEVYADVTARAVSKTDCSYLGRVLDPEDQEAPETDTQTASEETLEKLGALDSNAYSSLYYEIDIAEHPYTTLSAPAGPPLTSTVGSSSASSQETPSRISKETNDTHEECVPHSLSPHDSSATDVPENTMLFTESEFLPIYENQMTKTGSADDLTTLHNSTHCDSTQTSFESDITEPFPGYGYGTLAQPVIIDSNGFTAQPDGGNDGKTLPENDHGQPILSKGWQMENHFTHEGGRMQGEHSDVILLSPRGSVAKNTSVRIKGAISTDLAVAHLRLQLKEEEFIASPIAEYSAGNRFRFQKPVQILLPHFIPLGYDAKLFRVYCFQHDQDGRTIKLQELKLKNEDKETAESTDIGYFVFIENRRICISTNHFSGYLCTYCGKELKDFKPQVLYVQLYAMHLEKEEGGRRVDVRSEIWDTRVQIEDFREARRRISDDTLQPCGPLKCLRALKSRPDLDLSSVLIGTRLELNDREKGMWEHLKSADEDDLVFPVEKTIELTEFIPCDCRTPIPYEAEWQLRNKDGVNPSYVIEFLVVTGYVSSYRSGLVPSVQFMKNPEPVKICPRVRKISERGGGIGDSSGSSDSPYLRPLSEHDSAYGSSDPPPNTQAYPNQQPCQPNPRATVRCGPPPPVPPPCGEVHQYFTTCVIKPQIHSSTSTHHNTHETNIGHIDGKATIKVSGGAGHRQERCAHDDPQYDDVQNSSQNPGGGHLGLDQGEVRDTDLERQVLGNPEISATDQDPQHGFHQRLGYSQGPDLSRQDLDTTEIKGRLDEDPHRHARNPELGNTQLPHDQIHIRENLTVNGQESSRISHDEGHVLENPHLYPPDTLPAGKMQHSGCSGVSGNDVETRLATLKDPAVRRRLKDIRRNTGFRKIASSRTNNVKAVICESDDLVLVYTHKAGEERKNVHWFVKQERRHMMPEDCTFLENLNNWSELDGTEDGQERCWAGNVIRDLIENIRLHLVHV